MIIVPLWTCKKAFEELWILSKDKIERKLVWFYHFYTLSLQTVSKRPLFLTGVRYEIIPNTFFQTKERFTVRPYCTSFIIIFDFTSILFVERFYHFVLEQWSYRVVIRLKYYFLRSIDCEACFMLLPKFPFHFCTDNILLSFFKIDFYRRRIRLGVLKGVNILPDLSNFHEDNSGRRIVVIWKLLFHASFVLLIQRNDIFSTLWYSHSCVIWLVFFVIHR